MVKQLNMGIIGCGDLVQRWEAAPIVKSKHVLVKSLYDLRTEQAVKLQSQIGGEITDSAEAIFADQQVDIVCIFVPPWARLPLVEKAARAGKHIILTKPLAPTVLECAAIKKAIGNQVRCGVFYGRTGNAGAQQLKAILGGGEIGKLALYKQDWLHHYPTWNDWATDPARNGGPFMDAMIHNLNLAKYLMGRPVTKTTFFSDNYAHANLKCNDTEFMKVDFVDNGSAHLFITWAADLEVFDPLGNAREHIDIFYMITDQGWRLTQAWENGKLVITASKEGKTKNWTVKDLDETSYDAFASAVLDNSSFRPDIVTIDDAIEDVALLKNGK
ncbi:MAG TPA: Gfo/Idh/MocA family oxidoreductase [bacterium]|nr:Gfo/Idh/MocA family oxidoreductase [bacterium]HPN45740.1 Gfo/Idh/MocA family oxidoreductase [bacterium]